jgi:hypothetical protein
VLADVFLQEMRSTILGSADTAALRVSQAADVDGYISKYNSMREQCTARDSSNPGVCARAEGQRSWNVRPELLDCQVGCRCSETLCLASQLECYDLP